MALNPQPAARLDGEFNGDSLERVASYNLTEVEVARSMSRSIVAPATAVVTMLGTAGLMATAMYGQASARMRDIWRMAAEKPGMQCYKEDLDCRILGTFRDGTYYEAKGALRDLKSDINACVEFRYREGQLATPLMIAAANWNTEVVKYLLEAGANPNVTCPRSPSGRLIHPPPLAAALGLYPEYKYNKHGHEWESIFAQGNVQSLRERRDKVVESLLTAGADPNLGCKVEASTCPLYIAYQSLESASRHSYVNGKSQRALGLPAFDLMLKHSADIEAPLQYLSDDTHEYLKLVKERSKSINEPSEKDPKRH